MNSHQNLRAQFFNVVGLKDDGRKDLHLSRQEFRTFAAGKEFLEAPLPRGAKTIEVFFEFEPNYDVNYVYCFDDERIYESRLYIGD